MALQKATSKNNGEGDDVTAPSLTRQGSTIGKAAQKTDAPEPDPEPEPEPEPEAGGGAKGAEPEGEPPAGDGKQDKKAGDGKDEKTEEGEGEE